MATPAIQTLITDAQQVLNLKSLSEIRATMAAALANANVGTPLNPNLTTQQLWDEFYLIVRQPESDIESIITNQLMKFLYAPPAPGGVGANTQVIFNDNGVLAGDAGLTYNKTTDTLTLGTRLLVGVSNAATIGNPAIGVVGGALYDSQFSLIGNFTNNNTSAGKGVLLGFNNTTNNGIISAAYGNGTEGLTFWTHNGTGWGQRMELSAVGNVGVGIVPSAWNNNYNAIDIGANGSIAGRLGASNTVDITSNAFRNSAGDWIYKIATSNPAARYQVDGSTGSHIWYSGAAGTAGNIIAGFSTAAMTLNASGNLVFPSGKGIDFSAVTGGTGTATANVLNDYEEGTWVGTLTFSTTPQTSTNTFTGRYTKVGRLVSVQGYLLIGVGGFVKGSASGTLTITGLPFTSGVALTQYQDLAASIADISSGSLCFASVSTGGTAFSFESMSVSGAVVQRNFAGITAANFAATNAGFISLQLNITYTV